MFNRCSGSRRTKMSLWLVIPCRILFLWFFFFPVWHKCSFSKHKVPLWSCSSKVFLTSMTRARKTEKHLVFSQPLPTEPPSSWGLSSCRDFFLFKTQTASHPFLDGGWRAGLVGSATSHSSRALQFSDWLLLPFNWLGRRWKLAKCG